MSVAGVAALAALLTGVFTNEEQVEFAREGGKPAVTWGGMAITADGGGFANQGVDAFGRAVGPKRSFALEADGDGVALVSDACRRRMVADGAGYRSAGDNGRCTSGALLERVGPEGVRLRLDGQGVLDLRRARAFKCWAAVPKRAAKADPGSQAGAGGSADWWGKRDISLHDQGGRAELVTDEAAPQRFTLKMRNVVWPSGPNQPSLVLYVLTPAGGERAVAYSWADPGAKRVGINIRSMQASCSLAESRL